MSHAEPTPRIIYTEEGRFIVLSGADGVIVADTADISAVRKRSSVEFPCMVYFKAKARGFYCRDSHERVVEHWLQT